MILLKNFLFKKINYIQITHKPKIKFKILNSLTNINKELFSFHSNIFYFIIMKNVEL